MPAKHCGAGHSTAQSQELYRRAKQIIPGGTQLLSKRPEMYAPERWPAYYRSARGCEIVDLDGNHFVDMSLMGVGACLLGYADKDVTEAVIACVRDGSMCTLNAPKEVQLAEELIGIHPWADQVRLLRTGGEAMAAAVRIARGATSRNIVAICGYHGWHDWYLAANRVTDGSIDSLKGHLLPGLSPVGVPIQLAGTSLPFTYNNLDEAASIVDRLGDKLAAIVMEPARSADPLPGFLEGIRDLCNRCGAVLIFDEISAGWRFTFGGAHLQYGLDPDMAVFGKALGNGHPIAAVIGRESIMQVAQDSFISSTYWTEAVGPAAAVATLAKMRNCDVPSHIRGIALRFRQGLDGLGKKHGLPVILTGHPALTSVAFEHPDSAALMTLFTARMLDRGILCGTSFYPSFAHQEHHIDSYLNAADDVFTEVADAARQGDSVTRVGGLVKHVGFRRLA